MVYRLEERPRRQGIAALRRTPGIERQLAQTRTSRARIASDIRALLVRRNEATAMALADRVAVGDIAAAAEIKAVDVKRVGSGYHEFDSSGTPHRVHIARLAEIASQLRAAMEERAFNERQLRSEVEEALASGECDVFRVAAVAAVTAERVRELLRTSP